MILDYIKLISSKMDRQTAQNAISGDLSDIIYQMRSIQLELEKASRVDTFFSLAFIEEKLRIIRSHAASIANLRDFL